MTPPFEIVFVIDTADDRSFAIIEEARDPATVIRPMMRLWFPGSDRSGQKSITSALQWRQPIRRASFCFVVLTRDHNTLLRIVITPLQDPDLGRRPSIAGSAFAAYLRIPYQSEWPIVRLGKQPEKNFFVRSTRSARDIQECRVVRLLARTVRMTSR